LQVSHARLVFFKTNTVKFKAETQDRDSDASTLISKTHCVGLEAASLALCMQFSQTFRYVQFHRQTLIVYLQRVSNLQWQNYLAGHKERKRFKSWL